MSTEITKDSVLAKARELMKLHQEAKSPNATFDPILNKGNFTWEIIHAFPSIISLLESTLAENERLREDNTNLRNYKEAQEIIDKAPSSLSHES